MNPAANTNGSKPAEKALKKHVSRGEEMRQDLLLRDITQEGEESEKSDQGGDRGDSLTE